MSRRSSRVLRADRCARTGLRPCLPGAGRSAADRSRRPGRVRLPRASRKELPQYHLHPALLDACFQSMAGAVPLEPDGGYSPFTYMPTAVRRVVLLRAHLPEATMYHLRRADVGRRPAQPGKRGRRRLSPGRRRPRVGGTWRRARAARGPRRNGGRQKSTPRQWLYRVAWQAAPLDGRYWQAATGHVTPGRRSRG